MSKTAKTAPQSAEAAMPLFFSKPRPLDAKAHAAMGMKQGVGYGFSRDTNSAPLTAAEIVDAALSYPIVFTGDDAALPVAVLGLEQQNYFVGTKGAWSEGSYIPAYVRQYPFILMEVEDGKKLVLCVDEAAEHVTAKSPAQVFFASDGKPSDFTNQALQFCTALHQQHQATKGFVEALKKHELLAEQAIQVNVAEGKVVRLGGFKILDEANVNQLSDKAILELKSKNYLPLIYLVLASTRNWPRLARFATAATQKAA